jgi:hypothetical protein
MRAFRSSRQWIGTTIVFAITPLLATGHAMAKLEEQIYVSNPTATSATAFITYLKPLQASTVDSEGSVNLLNDFWSFKVQELDLDNDLKFDDIRVAIKHKGAISGNDFDTTKPGPALPVTFKDVDPVNPPANAKMDKGAHGNAAEDSLHAQWFYIAGNDFSELKLNMLHSPVPEPGVISLMSVGVGLLAAIGWRRQRSQWGQA